MPSAVAVLRRLRTDNFAAAAFAKVGADCKRCICLTKREALAAPCGVASKCANCRPANHPPASLSGATKANVPPVAAAAANPAILAALDRLGLELAWIAETLAHVLCRKFGEATPIHPAREHGRRP